jgi:hypothetical protein
MLRHPRVVARLFLAAFVIMGPLRASAITETISNPAEKERASWSLNVPLDGADSEPCSLRKPDGDGEDSSHLSGTWWFQTDDSEDADSIGLPKPPGAGQMALAGLLLVILGALGVRGATHPS